MANIGNALFSDLSDPVDLLNQVLAASTEHISVYDRSGHYLYINPAGLAALGLQAEDVLGKTGQELNLPHAPNLPAPILEHQAAQRESVFQTGIPAQGEMRFPTLQGDRNYEYVISPIFGNDGQVNAVTHTSRDITKRKQTEASLRKLNRELEIRVAERTLELVIANESLRLEIAERQKAEEVLQESEARFHALVNAIFEGVVIQENGKIIDANPGFASMFGYALEEVMGKSAVDFLTSESVETVLQHTENHNEFPYEVTGIRKDGTLIDLEVVGKQSLYQGRTVRISAARDITNRKRAEAALQESEILLRLFAQYAPVGIAMFDREMHYIMASQRWADDYCYSSLESLIGRSHYEIFPEIPEHWRQIHQRCLAGAIETCDEDLFMRGDNTQQWIRWEVRPWYTAAHEIGGIIIFAEDITQRNQTEISIQQLNQELQQKVTELQTLLDVIPIGIGIANDPECRNIRVNPAFAEALGIPSTRNASLSAPEEERPTNFKVYLNGREMAPEELPLQYAAAHGVEINDLEVEVVWQDGTTITLLEYAAPLFDEAGQPRGSIGAFLNISERKCAEAALRESEERYRILVQNFPNGAVCLFDQNLRYVVAGGQGLADVGLDGTQMEGKTIWEVFDPETCRLIEPGYRAVLAGHSHVIEIPYQDWIYRCYLLPLYNDRRRVQLGMVMTQEITLQKQAEQVLRTSRDQLEQQVQARTRELRQLTEELQRSNQELEQFAYVASHDLQEPLRAITSFTQLLAKRYREKLDAKADTYIEFIVDGAIRMQQLVRDLLTYSRVGRYELSMQPVDCNAILEQVKKDLQVAIAENQAIITVDPLPTLTADPTQMANLLQNLIGNALKYRSEAAPQIHISAKLITAEADRFSQDNILPLTPPAPAWRFAIQDNGIGIEPQYAERIFTIFQRLHTNDEYSGTGLGLAICRKIVERHQGRIWVESQLGRGATFFFTIPISITT